MIWPATAATGFLGLLFLAGWVMGYHRGLKYGRGTMNKQCVRCGHVYNADTGDHDCNAQHRAAVVTAIAAINNAPTGGIGEAVDALIVARIALYDRKAYER